MLRASRRPLARVSTGTTVETLGPESQSAHGMHRQLLQHAINRPPHSEHLLTKSIFNCFSFKSESIFALARNLVCVEQCQYHSVPPATTETACRARLTTLRKTRQTFPC